MSRVYNFFHRSGRITGRSIKRSSREMLDYKGCGMSVMEMSHRSSGVPDEIIERGRSRS